MNLILLESADFADAEQRRARLTGRRLAHLREVHRAELGDELRVGLVGGLIGTGRVVALDEAEAQLEVDLQGEPPAPLDLHLVLALPRPRQLKRCLEAAASLGVKEITLVNAWRVEKSYWQTPVLEEETLRHHLVLGLEQARDTVLPRVTQKKLFKPFVEDELPALVAGKRALVAHPVAPLVAEAACPEASAESTVLCIGPEGGWLPYEVDKLVEAGCRAVGLGPRILRTEVALPTLVARLTPLK